MSRNRKPRKAYRPRPVNLDAHKDAIRGVSFPSIGDRTIWQQALKEALDAVAQGRAGQAHWSEIFDGINILEQLVFDGWSTDEGASLKAAQDACVAILDRLNATGIRSARASELAALRAVVHDWDPVIKQITYGERAQVLKRLNARIQRALHAPPNTLEPAPRVFMA